LGKSALLEHGAWVAREAGSLVLRARGHELESAFAWGVARSLFEGLLLDYAEPERRRLLDGPAAPARQVFDDSAKAAPPTPGAGFAIMHGMYWLALRLAQREPLLLVVDDGHWADEPSLRFLVYLLGRVSDAPIGVLVASRSREAGAGGMVDLLADDPATRVRSLRPLGVAAVGELIQQRVKGAGEGFVDAVRARGHPPQLQALRAFEDRDRPTRRLWTPVPRRRRARSNVRCCAASTLIPHAQALAEAVAVLRTTSSCIGRQRWHRSNQSAVAAADELVRADLLRPGNVLGFVHPLLRAAIYGSLPKRIRAQTHRRAAQLLADAGATGEQVCAHLLEAPPLGDEGVVDTLRATAGRALAQGVPASAVNYLERALREPPSPAARRGVLAELGRAEATAGRSEALPHLEAAIALAVDAEERARLLLEFGRCQHHVGRLDDACDARRGLGELEQAHRAISSGSSWRAAT
jgi:hypothetical protein